MGCDAGGNKQGVEGKVTVLQAANKPPLPKESLNLRAENPSKGHIHKVHKGNEENVAGLANLVPLPKCPEPARVIDLTSSDENRCDTMCQSTWIASFG